MTRPTPRHPASAWPGIAKPLLLALYLAFDHAAIGERVASLGPSPALAAYAVLYAALVLALAAAALARPAALRIALAMLLAAGSVMLQSYEWTTGAPLVYDAFETMVDSRGDAGHAMAQHGGTLLRAGLAALVLFAAIALPPGRLALPFGLGWIVPLLAVASLAGLLYLRGGEGARALPAPFSPLAQGAIMAGLHALEDDRPRQAVAIAPGPALAKGDIVLVIDESIAARYLDINHPAGVRSGLARARRGVVTANFGVAAAVTNCSAGSNLTLRYGGTRETYREAAEDMPSIWAYARRAGRRTVYLDAQRERGALQNLMTPAEAAEIDDFVQLGTTPVADRDRALARRLGARLGNGVAEFILVNKVGAHFPIADKFPLAAARYRPLPPRGRTAGITDIAALPGQAADSDEEWRRYRNAYRNTLVWSTAGFFDLLLPRVAGSGAVLLYTADHGQNLYERGGAGGPTHCVPEPAGGEEGAVPLVVIAAAGAEGTAAERGAAEPSTAPTDWRAVAAARRDAMSHFRIFPTLLALMGYESATTAPLYGPTLLSPEPDPMTFTPNYNAALGRDPSWYRVDPAALAAPPTGDYAAGTRDR